MFITGMIVGSVLTIVSSLGYFFVKMSTDKDDLLAQALGKKFESGLRLIGLGGKKKKAE